MSGEYGNDLVTVVDDEGNQHQFEVLDAIETDTGRYVALVPVYDNPSDLINDDGELVILTVKEENGEDLLLPIEDDDEFEEIAEIFEERLADLYEVEEMESEPGSDKIIEKHKQKTCEHEWIVVCAESNEAVAVMKCKKCGKKTLRQNEVIK